MESKNESLNQILEGNKKKLAELNTKYQEQVDDMKSGYDRLRKQKDELAK